MKPKTGFKIHQPHLGRIATEGVVLMSRYRRRQGQMVGEKGKIPVRRRRGEEQGDYESEIHN
jgi:hypothetical protein